MNFFFILFGWMVEYTENVYITFWKKKWKKKYLHCWMELNQMPYWKKVFFWYFTDIKCIIFICIFIYMNDGQKWIKFNLLVCIHKLFNLMRWIVLKIINYYYYFIFWCTTNYKHFFVRFLEFQEAIRSNWLKLFWGYLILEQ